MRLMPRRVARTSSDRVGLSTHRVDQLVQLGTAYPLLREREHHCSIARVVDETYRENFTANLEGFRSREGQTFLKVGCLSRCRENFSSTCAIVHRGVKLALSTAPFWLQFEQLGGLNLRRFC